MALVSHSACRTTISPQTVVVGIVHDVPEVVQQRGKYRSFLLAQAVRGADRDELVIGDVGRPSDRISLRASTQFLLSSSPICGRVAADRASCVSSSVIPMPLRLSISWLDSRIGPKQWRSAG